ncbi:hypothetical protein DPO11_22850 [Salmonella enterica]|nr:hypothetical protein [Salmonella enterica]
MNQSDEESLKRDYCAGVMTLREIGRKYGITEGAVRKKARAKKWVRKQVRKSGTQNEECVPKKRTSKNTGKPSNGAGSEGTDDGTKTGTKIPDFLPETKRQLIGRGAGRPFTAHNTASLKHGAYARRMLWPDDIIADAPNTELMDELLLLRSANLFAAENIGRWRVQLEDATPEEQKNLREQIAAAEKGMRLNIASIESLEYSIRNNLRVEASTAKLRAEVQKLTAENQGVKTPLTEAIDELQSLNKGGRL